MNKLTNQNNKLEITEDRIELFFSILTKSLIEEFSEECKKRHLQSRAKDSENKINNQNFLTIMKHIIKDTQNYILIEPILEKIFFRFKSVKCLLASETLNVKEKDDREKQKKKERNDKDKDKVFFLNQIISDEKEAEVYDISVVLSLFMKCSFDEKIEVLFNITDIDKDGYINEKEIKKIIFSVNNIFSDEQCPIIVESSIISQSLASIKANQIYNQIIYSPGNLTEIIMKEKYVQLCDLIEAIKKIPNYKLTILPKINLLDCINTEKKEPEFNISKKNLKEFLSITMEINSNPTLIASNTSSIINKIKDNNKRNNNNQNLPKIDKKNRIKEVSSSQMPSSVNLNHVPSNQHLSSNIDLKPYSLFFTANQSSNQNQEFIIKDDLLNHNVISIKKEAKKKQNQVSDDAGELHKLGFDKLNNLLQPGIINIQEKSQIKKSEKNENQLAQKSSEKSNKKFVSIASIIKELDSLSYKNLSDFDMHILEMTKKTNNIKNSYKLLREVLIGQKNNNSILLTNMMGKENSKIK